MRKLLLLAVAALVGGLVPAGCGGDDEDPGSGAAASSSAVPFDRAFIDAMVPHHESAIEMAKAAKAAGLTQPDLIAIADDIIGTQQAEIDQMLDWREEWYGSRELDPGGADALGLSESQMGMQHDPADLAGADDVDATFAAMMIDHHQGAITMASLADDMADHDDLREMAGRIVDAQSREIDIMEAHMSGAMQHE